jgi:ribonuclease T2
LRAPARASIKLLRRAAAWAIGAACAAFAGPLAAQGFDEVRGAPAGQFDFYVLALTWSPGFCALEDGRPSQQCAPGSRLGFVVHGLWPQYEHGYPAYCRPLGGSPSPAFFEAARGLFPNERVAGQEWHKHGTCTGLSPADFVDAVRRARALVRVPDQLAEASTTARVLPFEIERAFLAANPGLSPGAMAVMCRRRVFDEVRICLDRDLHGFHRCPEVERDACRAGEVVVKGAP